MVYHRFEGGKRISLLDTGDFPEKIQGYARIASFVDHAFYVFPISGKLSSADGELAVLLQSFGVRGTLEVIDGSVTADMARAALRGTDVGGYTVEERVSGSSVLRTEGFLRLKETEPSRALVYVDRVFPVKGVGTVALGFVLVRTCHNP